ncbi:hypothetical protein FB567DRAFT_536145 [Paraphoma chrysanthemicola]|uniref:Uncharacterized protein n=1 Tax=Paraphoma chrysanthemicola TaxID=798071 RepID=A0A8K0VTS3_9PLEO|nr:hypothetical protein FB567DRAFT_536145 [Paraphoma chrysanthemicola]
MVNPSTIQQLQVHPSLDAQKEVHTLVQPRQMILLRHLAAALHKAAPAGVLSSRQQEVLMKRPLERVKRYVRQRNTPVVGSCFAQSAGNKVPTCSPATSGYRRINCQLQERLDSNNSSASRGVEEAQTSPPACSVETPPRLIPRVQLVWKLGLGGLQARCLYLFHWFMESSFATMAFVVVTRQRIVAGKRYGNFTRPCYSKLYRCTSTCSQGIDRAISQSRVTATDFWATDRLVEAERCWHECHFSAGSFSSCVFQK